jgi:hypothetical protein
MAVMGSYADGRGTRHSSRVSRLTRHFCRWRHLPAGLGTFAEAREYRFDASVDVTSM